VPSTSELLQLRQNSTIQNGMPLNAPVLPMSLVNKAQAGMALQKKHFEAFTTGAGHAHEIGE